jgi:drug/metabolite transporter (DMT)-like permease
MNYTIDTGTNLASLGFAYLFFRFVWPVLLIVGLILVIVGVGYYFYRRSQPKTLLEQFKKRP